MASVNIYKAIAIEPIDKVLVDPLFSFEQDTESAKVEQLHTI
jgi:hypothetical protein